MIIVIYFLCSLKEQTNVFIFRYVIWDEDDFYSSDAQEIESIKTFFTTLQLLKENLND